MKISNNPSDEKKEPFAELFQLQTEFQARLADETLRYLRRLQGAAAPASPGTVVIPEGVSALKASGSRGGAAEFELEIENLQRVYCTASPALSPLVSASGITWFPESEATPASLLVPPNTVAELKVRVAVPAQLPGGLYRGCLMLHGFSNGALPVALEVEPVDDPKPQSHQPPSTTGVSPGKSGRAGMPRKAKRAAKRRKKR